MTHKPSLHTYRLRIFVAIISLVTNFVTIDHSFAKGPSSCAALLGAGSKIGSVTLKVAKYFGIAAWEIGGVPVRMLLTFIPNKDTRAAGQENFAVTGRGALNYAIRLHLNDAHLRNKQILDLGSGRSFFVDIVNSIYGETGTRAIALDRFVTDVRVGNGSFVQADMRSLPFGRESFDLVTSVWSMNYFADNNNKDSLVKALREAIRVAKPGGEVRIAYNWAFGKKHFRVALEEISQDTPIDYTIGWVNPIFGITATGLITVKVRMSHS